MKCSKCGAEIPEGAKFCTECGTKISEEAAVHETPPVQQGAE
ncbi:zinc-ribbon domain-containing protein [Faecalicatena contorta]